MRAAYPQVNKPGGGWSHQNAFAGSESDVCRKDIKDWSFFLRSDRLPNTIIHAIRQIGLKGKTAGFVPTPIIPSMAATA